MPNLFHKSKKNSLIYENDDVIIDVLYLQSTIAEEAHTHHIHSHPEFELNFCIKGRFSYTFPEFGKTMTISKNQFFLIPPYTKHLILEESPDSLKLSTQFIITPKQTDGTSFFENAVRKFREPQLFHSNKIIVQDIHKIIRLENFNHHKCYNDLLYFSYGSLILDTFLSVTEEENSSNQKTFNDIRLDEAVKYIEKNISATTTVEEVAEHIHISKRQLERLFDKVIGMSPGIYIKYARIRKIKTLLINPDLSLDDIAEKLHYNSVSSLIKSFKTIEGTTPARFRKIIYHL